MHAQAIEVKRRGIAALEEDLKKKGHFQDERNNWMLAPFPIDRVIRSAIFAVVLLI